MAVNSSTPVIAVAPAAKAAAPADARSKVPASAAGTPVFPPTKLPSPAPATNAQPPAAPAASTPGPARSTPAGSAPPAAAPSPGTPAAAVPPLAPALADPAAASSTSTAGTPVDLATARAAAPVRAPAASPPSRPRTKPAPTAEPAASVPLTAQLPLALAPDPTPGPQPAPAAAGAAATVSPTASAASPPAAASAGALPVVSAALPRPTAAGTPPSQPAQEDGDTADLFPVGDPAGHAAALAAPAEAVRTVSSGTAAVAVAPARSTDDAPAADAAPAWSVFGLDPGTAHGLAAPATPAAAQVQTPVGTSGWAEELGTQVLWMAHQGIAAASLRLQPEHLGPVEVRISLHDSAASVWFGAHEPETRAALQIALPQLKDLFAAQGMLLADAGVSREPPREAPSGQRLPASPAVLPATPGAQESSALAGSRRGLIDTYA
ncbi:MAG: flagellar hook-length control protein FliK [Proteobacteria bacterium]|nr:flagellar hook-length control protein FliK [Pseudomonadota bacterium]